MVRILLRLCLRGQPVVRAARNSFSTHPPARSHETDCLSGLDEPAFNVGTDCDEAGLDFRMIDVGLAGGAGIDIGLTDSVDARLGLLYTLGLSNVSADVGGPLKHRALTIRAGLVLPII